MIKKYRNIGAIEAIQFQDLNLLTAHQLLGEFDFFTQINKLNELFKNEISRRALFSDYNENEDVWVYKNMNGNLCAIDDKTFRENYENYEEVEE